MFPALMNTNATQVTSECKTKTLSNLQLIAINIVPGVISFNFFVAKLCILIISSYIFS